MSGVQSSVPELPASHRLLVLDEVGSTNAEAMRLGLAGDDGPLWVMAKRQISGKGRAGRSWEQGAGNLYASLLFSPVCRAETVPQLSFVAGLALYDAVNTLAAQQGLVPNMLADLRLKWPNDGLIGGKKFAGILCESVMRPLAGTSENATQVVVGIGINLAEIPATITRPVTSLRVHGINADPKVALTALAIAFAHWQDVWVNGTGFKQICRAWTARSGPPGEAISVHAGNERIAGFYGGIDENGALLMRDADGKLRTFNFGDVSISRAPKES